MTIRKGSISALRVNFVDGGDESEGLIFSGSEGTMEIGVESAHVSQMPARKNPGHTIDTFTDAMQKRILGGVPTEVSRERIHRNRLRSTTRSMWLPRDIRDSYDHFKNFFAAVRSRQPVVEDAVFGYRAAGAALLSNLSVERGAVVKWDPDNMKLVS